MTKYAADSWSFLTRSIQGEGGPRSEYAADYVAERDLRIEIACPGTLAEYDAIMAAIVVQATPDQMARILEIEAAWDRAARRNAKRNRAATR